MAGNHPAADAEPAATYAGAIDGDLHPALPGMSVLLPYPACVTDELLQAETFAVSIGKQYIVVEI